MRTCAITLICEVIGEVVASVALSWGVGCYRDPTFDRPCSITCTSTCPEGLACDEQLHVCVAPGDDCHDQVPMEDVAFASVTAGTDFACGLADDRALWCWGNNADHQIDPGPTQQFPVPRRVGVERWDAIAAGGRHVCGLRDGHLYCWGRNDVYQAVGRDAVAATPTEIIVPAVTRWSFVGTGPRSTCAIGDGKLYCWGFNKKGSLGTNEISDLRMSVHQVDNPRADWTRVALGATHTCALAGAGSAGADVDLYCFGNDEYGKTGGGGTIATPIATAAWSALALSDAATCATKADGTLWCFGAGGAGELGPDHVFDTSATPIQLGTDTGWTTLAASFAMFCGLRGDAVVCWGSANLGGLPAGTWTNTSHAYVTAIAGGATGVALGWSQLYVPTVEPSPRADRAPDHELGCALVGTHLQCWGDDRDGQLGIRATTTALVPTPLVDDPRFDAIALGGAHGCGVVGGAVSCWGSTVLGQAGTASGTPASPCGTGVPCDLPAPRPLGLAGVTALATGRDHTCALHGQEITCWGDNRRGQLGDGALTSSTPRTVAGTWQTLYPTGGDRQCARAVDDTVWCWGEDAAPAPAPALAAFAQYAIGRTFACYLTAAGDLFCEGDNTRGQFGAPTPSTAATPMAMARTYRAIAASAESDHACGLRVDGDVECWGDNARGQTGGPTATTTAPFVLPMHGCTAISTTAAASTLDDSSAGPLPRPYAASCAVCGGVVSCWGDDRAGALGDGTRDDLAHAVPTALPARPDDPDVALVGGGGFTCARTASQQTRCWGTSPHGGLGIGGTPASLPVVVNATRPL